MTEDEGRIVPVRDMPAPRRFLCWVSAPGMGHCGLYKGHLGEHTWQTAARLKLLEAEVQRLRAQLEGTSHA